MKRLKTVLNLINGTILADIGCDHGYLAIDAIKENKVKKAYCMDINLLPLENAKKNIIKNNLIDKIELILSDGIEKLPIDVDVVTICGMGGLLIKDILEKGLSKLNNVKYLILEPNNNQNILRKFLNDSNFKIINEDICLEKGHIYEIIVVELGKMNLSYEEIEFGPFLLKEKNELFIKKYKSIINNLELQLKNVKNDDSREKLIEKIEFYRKNTGVK